MTAAHKSLPFGTKVKVTNKRNGRSIIVTITDRGPFIRGRVIDLTMAGANAIGMGYGIAPVTLDRL
jgi:rare lipoprotein A